MIDPKFTVDEIEKRDKELSSFRARVSDLETELNVFKSSAMHKLLLKEKARAEAAEKRAKSAQTRIESFKKLLSSAGSSSTMWRIECYAARKQRAELQEQVARKDAALREVYPWYEGEHSHDHPSSVLIRKALSPDPSWLAAHDKEVAAKAKKEEYEKNRVLIAAAAIAAKGIKGLMCEVEEKSGRAADAYFSGEAASLTIDMCKELEKAALIAALREPKT